MRKTFASCCLAAFIVTACSPALAVTYFSENFEYSGNAQAISAGWETQNFNDLSVASDSMGILGDHLEQAYWH